jgi:hypothetical protein
MPIILATQEAEIRRTAVQSQLGQIVCENLSQKFPTQNRADEWPKWSRACLANLSSNPSTTTTTKKKKKKKRIYLQCNCYGKNP